MTTDAQTLRDDYTAALEQGGLINPRRAAELRENEDWTPTADRVRLAQLLAGTFYNRPHIAESLNLLSAEQAARIRQRMPCPWCGSRQIRPQLVDQQPGLLDLKCDLCGYMIRIRPQHPTRPQEGFPAAIYSSAADRRLEQPYNDYERK